MKALILKSSGNVNGSSNILASEFARGICKAGGEAIEYDVYRADVHPCSGCNRCGMSGSCVFNDDYERELKNLIREADLLAFAMPVYYYNWPAQLKAVVDRFYSFTGELARMHKKTVLLTVAWDSSETVFAVTEAYYRQLCSYMQFQDCGMVLGGGCGTPDMTRATQYPEAAYELGKSCCK